MSREAELLRSLNAAAEHIRALETLLDPLLSQVNPRRLLARIERQSDTTPLEVARGMKQITRRELARMLFLDEAQAELLGEATVEKAVERGRLLILLWESWTERVPPDTAARLAELLDVLPDFFALEEGFRRPHRHEVHWRQEESWECDVCMNVWTSSDAGGVAADLNVMFARVEGWYISAELDLCPDCYRDPEVVAQFGPLPVVFQWFVSESELAAPPKGADLLHWSGRTPETSACGKRRLDTDLVFPASTAQPEQRCKRAGCRHRWEKYDAAVGRKEG